VLWVTAELLRIVGICCLPFIPRAAAQLLDLLAAPSDERMLADAIARLALRSGAVLPEPQGIFPRYVEPTDA
jgi:methionyl-tRNA synthetase